MTEKTEKIVYRSLKIILRRLSKKEYYILERLTYRSKNIYNHMIYSLKNNLLEDNNLSLLSKLYRYVREKTDDGKFLHSQSIQKIAEQIVNILRNTPVKKLKFIKKDSHRTVVWKGQSVKIKDNKILLPLSKEFRKYYEIENKYLEIDIPQWLTKYKINEVLLIPRLNGQYFELRITYQTKIKNSIHKSEDIIMGIDLGVNNFATIVINDGTAIIFDGRKLKSVNQYYNKERTRLQSIYSKQGIKCGSKLKRLSKYRKNFIDNFMYQVASRIVKIVIEHKVSKIVIGENKNWKKGVNIGKVNNQNFVMIPHSKFKTILKHKAELYGIKVIFVDESYTSKVDSLVFEEIKEHDKYKGKRIKRGLFLSSRNIVINSDVNGAINIARKGLGDKYWIKSIPESLNGIGGSGRLTRPLRIRVV